MNIEEFNGIIKECIKEYPYSKCDRIDTFAHIGTSADIDNNLGFTDFNKAEKNGMFWSRKWVNKKRSAYECTYPIGATQVMEVDMACCKWIVQLMVFDIETCSMCDCSKNIAQVKTNIANTLKALKDRAYEYGVRGGVWSADKTKKLDNGVLSSFKNHVKIKTDTITPVPYNKAGAWFAWIEFEISSKCEKTDTSKFKPHDSPEREGNVKCTSCE